MATTDLLLPPISGGGGGAADGGVLHSDPPAVTPDLIRGLPTVLVIANSRQTDPGSSPGRRPIHPRVATLPAKTFPRANSPQPRN